MKKALLVARWEFVTTVKRRGYVLAVVAIPVLYGGLFALFRLADDRYNSGLFHFGKEKDRPEVHDELTPRLKLDDKVVKPLLRGL